MRHLREQGWLYSKEYEFGCKKAELLPSRARVNSFMNKFKKLGLIDYNGGLAPTICARHMKKKPVEAGIKFTASPPMKL